MRHTSRLKTFIWYSSVTLLVTFAVLVTVVRLTIGSVSDYRTRLEEVAGRYLGQPVTISSMDTRLVGFRPSVLLNNVSLLEKGTRERLAHFDQIAISLEPFSSLISLQPIIELSIHGANIVVGLNENGSLRVQGVSLSKSARNEGSGGALGAWFLSQARLALVDSRLVWRDFDTGKEQVFSGVNLELQNLQDRHRLSGYVKLPKALGKSLRLSLDIRGNLLNRKDWLGELYLKAEQLHPALWLQPYDYKGLQLKQGQVDMELWSNWQGGLLQGVVGQFDLGDLVISDGSAEQSLKKLAGRLRYASSDEGWRLQLRNLRIQSEKEQVEPLAIELQHTDESTVLQATALPLLLVKRYGPYLPQLSAKQRQWLTHASPGGWVRDIYLELGQGGKVRATADLNKLQVDPWQRYPGVKGLSGHLAVDWPQAVIVVDSHDMALELPRLFRSSLPVEQATGVVRLQKEENQWRVAGTMLRLTTPDIKANVAFDSWISTGEAPLFALSAQVEDGKVSAVPRYLPVHIMSEGSVDWLDNAFVRGRITSGRVLIHGRLSDFPFRDRQGHFEVTLDTDNVSLHYRDNWPDLHAVAGEVNFEGGGMSIEAHRATVFGASMQRTRVAIDNFRQPVLKVAGRAKATVNDALQFLRASPLSEHAGKVLEQMNGEGPTLIDLDLAIPLNDAVAESRPLSVDGHVEFQGNSMHVAEGVDLSDMQGKLHFTESAFDSPEIQASLFGEPAIITVFTQGKNDKKSKIAVAAQGRASTEALQQAFKWPILSRLKGSTDWQARLDISRGENAGSVLNIRSSLKGVAVDLPAPAAKEQGSVRPLSVAWQLSGEEPFTHHLQYGDLVKAVWQQNSTPFRLQRASIVFGPSSKPALPKESKIQIGGSLGPFSPKAWTRLRDELLGSNDTGSSGALLPVEVRMKRLYLQSDKESEQADEEQSTAAVTAVSRELHTSDVPAINVKIDDFAYGDLHLGSLGFRGQPEDKAVVISALQLSSPNYTMSGKGRWEEGGNTQFDVDLGAGDLGRMLRDLGFASIINHGKVHSHGTVFWPGSPAAFNLGKLGGQLHVEIKEGVIKDVDPGAGKLLGLLSLQALPRRFFLDFSDLAGKGLQFSVIEGDIRFENGDVFTQNLHLESSPANVLITGRTGLVKKDFEQLIAVVPNVSGTVSVAGALAWGPQVAAVLLVLQKIFKSNIDAATMIRYELTGSWDKPKLTKLEPVKPETPTLVE